MRNLVNYIAFCSLLFLVVASKKNVTTAQKQDLSIFKNVLLNKEGRLDLHTSENTILSAIQELENEFSTEHSLLDQYKLYGATLSKIQCGHTQIHPNREVFREWLAARKSLAFDMYLIGKRLVVNDLMPVDIALMGEGKSAFEKKKRITPGSEILSIDDKTVDDMMHEIGHFLSSDEDGIEFKYFQAAPMFDFFRHLASPFTKDSIHVRYVFKGDTNDIYMRPGTAPVRTMNARLNASSLAFKEHEADMGKFKIVQKCGYFRFTSFKSAYGKKYDLFLEQSFKKMKARKVKKLIIDLRGNTGGVMQYSFMRFIVGKDVNLGRYIVEKPKHGIESRFIKKINADYIKHKLVTKAQKRLQRKGKFNNGIVKTKNIDPSLIYDGDIIVITDEGTFSSAAMLACHLKTLGHAKIVGRTAGGSFYGGNAGTLILQLPNSKLKMFINPNTFYSHLEPSNDPFAIKQPDLILNPLITDRNREDDYYFKQAKNAFK